MYLKKQTRVILDEDELKKNNDQISSDALFLNKFYKKKYPKLFNSFFPIKEALKLSKFELGVNCVKSKEELSRILGVNSMLKYFLSIFFSILYDLKYGYHLRKGIDLPKKLLQKYIKATRQ
jgi:hypothetical protein